MAINQPWARVAPDSKPGPRGQEPEVFPGAVHRIHVVAGDRLIPEARLTIRVYPHDQLVDQWQVDASGSPDYTQRPVQRYPDPIGEYTLTVQGKAALQILGLDDDPIPAPVGTPTNQRWSSLAQAYRYLHTLPEFAEAQAV